jgi:hypothetical protein
MTDLHHCNLTPEETSSNLLEQCVSAQENGAIFPTIWSVILKDDPLVAVLPKIRSEKDGMS